LRPLHLRGARPKAGSLAEAARTTQRPISYHKTEAGFPPTPAIISLAAARRVTTDELLGVKPLRLARTPRPPAHPRVEEISEDRRPPRARPESRPPPLQPARQRRRPRGNV